jgi:outer membrane protein assembly factor BamB
MVTWLGSQAWEYSRMTHRGIWFRSLASVGRCWPLLALVWVGIGVGAAQAENWPQFRGPLYNGSTTETNLPTKWSLTENVRWSIDLPGPSSATPAVWGDQVFVSSTDLQNDALKAFCFDRLTGRLLWQHDVAKGVRKDTRSTFSGPSPATDGKVVVFWYGNGDLVAYDLAGSKQWQKNVGPFAFQWTFSTSPVIYDGKLFLQILQRDTAVGGQGLPSGNPSFILALDPATGKELWKQERPSSAAAESLESFATPMPFEYEGRRELLVVGGDVITGHDVATGKELWRWGTWNPERIGHWRLVPSPIAGNGVVLACAPKKSPIYAVPLGKTGTIPTNQLLWISDVTDTAQRHLSSDVPTPAFYDGDFFILNESRNSLSRVEPRTGKIKWTMETPGRSKYEASPLAADGKLYLINFDGEVSVVNAADGKLINVVPMDPDPKGFIRSSVIAAHGNLFIRTENRLYCIGK